MINLDIPKYPTFFGCSAAADVPLDLYIPNSPWSAYTNYSYTLSRYVLNRFLPRAICHVLFTKPFPIHSFIYRQLDLVFENDFNIATFSNEPSTKNGRPVWRAP